MERERRAATEGELEEILRNLLGFRNKRVASMIVLGMYTGMRSNEIAEALRAEIYLDEIPYLKIMKGKSQAALREIPLHSIVKPLVESLVAQGKARDSQWLIQGLNPGETDSKRNHYIVTAISSYLRTKAKVLDKNVVFHASGRTLLQPYTLIKPSQY